MSLRGKSPDELQKKLPPPPPALLLTGFFKMFGFSSHFVVVDEVLGAVVDV